MSRCLRPVRHRIVVALIISLLGGGVASAPVSVSAAPAWLDYFNAFRAMANVPTLTEDPNLSAGDVLHSQYMVLNNTITHVEVAGNLGYTPAGALAGQRGNVAVSSGNPNYTFQNALDGWMTGPFHEVGMIDPRLAQTGFGLFSNFTVPQGNIDTGATLDVLSTLTNPSATTPVSFPANAKTMTLRQYDGSESPDPLTAASCAGYTAPTGPPLVLMLQNTNVAPSVTAYTVTRDGTPGNLTACEFDETNYTNPDGGQQSLGRAVLGPDRHAIILMPRNPLTDGIYHVSITSGGTSYNWAFAVGAAVIPVLQSITVVPANEGVIVGRTQQYTATGNYSNGTTQDLTGAVTWASTNTAAATISATGLVTTVAIGTTTITAVSGAVTGTATLNVLASPLPPVRPAAPQGGQSPPLPLARPAAPTVGTPGLLPPPR